MEYDDLAGLDATGILAAAEERMRSRRAGDVQDLLHVLRWCDLHSVDPQAEPGGVPKSRGGNYLRQIGGDGTPEVADLCFAELAIARSAGELSTSNLAADALDLRHRMPLLWAGVVALRVEAWVARMARKLGKDRVGLVDAAVSAAIHESPGRLLEMLTTQPHQAAAFLDSLDADPAADPVAGPTKPKRKARPARITVHITDTVLWGAAGVARVEGIGPVLLDKLSELLEGRDLDVLPVIDLASVRSVNGYEHPTSVKQRTVLRTNGDVFPHSSSRGTSRLDHDHPTPYQSGGPPGQTGDHADAPLTRRHHRAKTHLGYRCDQIALGAYRWITPHGLARLVGPTGTRKIEILRNSHGEPVGETYDGPPVTFHLRP